VVQDVLKVLRSGQPASWASDMTRDDWHGAMEARGFAEMFTAAMDCRGLYLGQKLARALDLAGRARMLDIGGGSGVYACCLVAANPGLRATVFEKSPVDEIAARRIEARGLSERIAVVRGDLFADKTESSLMQSSSRPNSFARRVARTSGVKPEWKPVRGSSTGSSSR
jgi:acetylserotonin N-methyltransferase